MDSPAGAPLLFEELATGERFQSPRRTVTGEDIERFAELSGDHNPLHCDETFAARSPYRGRIAHGLLVQAFATGLASDLGIFHGTTLGIVGMDLRFEAPVRPGDAIRLALTVLEKDPEPGRRRGWVRFGAEVVNQRGEVVITGEWKLVMARQRAGRRGPAGEVSPPSRAQPFAPGAPGAEAGPPG